jgi:uncharacterized protein YheU (UPF0270 family)
MARTWITASIAMATTILLAHDGTVAQRGHATQMSDNLAVEIVDHERPGSQLAVIDGTNGGYLETSPARWLPDWKQPDGVPPLTRLRLRALTEGGAVRIKVFAVFDDSNPVDSPGAKYGAREQLVASQLVREGETIIVRELTDFGVEPPLLRVVKANPRPAEQSLATGGEAVSKVKAVEVIAFWLDTSESTWYRLSLRNLTQKNITAMQLYEAEGGRRGGFQTEMQAGSARPLIAAGGMYETQVSGGGSSGTMTPQGFVPDLPRRLTYVVGTVVFDDGTYEGEAEVAARMEARQVGRRLQLGRVVPLLKALLESPDQDARWAVEELKSRVSTLRIDVDVSVVNELLARYPSLSGVDQKRNLTELVMDGLRAGRETVLHAIKEFERTGARDAGSGNFRVWVRKTHDKYEAMTRDH